MSLPTLSGARFPRNCSEPSLTPDIGPVIGRSGLSNGQGDNHVFEVETDCGPRSRGDWCRSHRASLGPADDERHGGFGGFQRRSHRQNSGPQGLLQTKRTTILQRPPRLQETPVGIQAIQWLVVPLGGLCRRSRYQRQREPGACGSTTSRSCSRRKKYPVIAGALFLVHTEIQILQSQR